MNRPYVNGVFELVGSSGMLVLSFHIVHVFSLVVLVGFNVANEFVWLLLESEVGSLLTRIEQDEIVVICVQNLRIS